MIVVDNNNIVIASSPLIQRCDDNGEYGIIKVWFDQEFYYIGTQDRDTYQIVDGIDADMTKKWSYSDGVLSEIISPTQSN